MATSGDPRLGEVRRIIRERGDDDDIAVIYEYARAISRGAFAAVLIASLLAALAGFAIGLVVGFVI